VHRDIYTTELMKKFGVNAFFSGCLTLTLKNRLDHLPKTDLIYVADADLSRFYPETYERLVPKEIRDKAIPVRHDLL
jgi:hypothetical protein